jgi:transcription initiation factor TFIIE subunit alpha
MCTDRPLLIVNGAGKAFSQVTEDDQEMMTPEEYGAYFEVFQAKS